MSLRAVVKHFIGGLYLALRPRPQGSLDPKDRKNISCAFLIRAHLFSVTLGRFKHSSTLMPIKYWQVSGATITNRKIFMSPPLFKHESPIEERSITRL